MSVLLIKTVGSRRTDKPYYRMLPLSARLGHESRPNR